MSTESKFKVGDSVYLYPIGWGIIEIVNEYDYKVYFHVINQSRFISAEWINLLSFTEYMIEGISQERPEVQPEFGQIVWVRNEFPGNWAIGHFYKKLDDYYYVSDYVGQKEWSKRGLEITTKNPYDKSNF